MDEAQEVTMEAFIDDESVCCVSEVGRRAPRQSLIKFVGLYETHSPTKLRNQLRGKKLRAVCKFCNVRTGHHVVFVVTGLS